MYRRIIRRLCGLQRGFFMMVCIFFSFHRQTGGQFSWSEVYACRRIEGQLTLRCPANHRIMIFSANYGNASGYNCSTHFTPEHSRPRTKVLLTPSSFLIPASDAANPLPKQPRCNHDMTSFVKDLCSGRDVCLIEMEENIFRSPCNGDEALEVKFACIPGTQVISVCNRNLTSPDGHILSPGYPEYYPGPTDCSWRISTDAGKNILIMLNDLSLRPLSAKDASCQDYLIIYEDDRQLVKTCHSYPFNLQIASNTARISLVSTSRGWTSKGVWLFYKTIGCGNPSLPDLVQLVSRNYTNVVLKCKDSFFFHDALHPYEHLVLTCVDGARYDRSVPNFPGSSETFCYSCPNDHFRGMRSPKRIAKLSETTAAASASAKLGTSARGGNGSNDSDWRKNALSRLQARHEDIPIAMLNGATLKEIVIPSTVIGVVLIILIAALGIFLTLRRHRRRGIVYHQQEIEHLHVVRKAPRAQIDSATDLAGSYPLTEIRD